MKNELHVEQYDASEVESKKKKILKIVATGVGAAALTTMLGCYGLQNRKAAEPITVNKDSVTVNIDLDTVPAIVPPEPVPMIEHIMGGNGAWFNSVIVFLEA